MEVPDIVKQYKKEIIFFGLLVGVGVIFDFIKLDAFDGWMKWGCLAVIALAGYLFNEFYANRKPARRTKRAGPAPPGQESPPQRYPMNDIYEKFHDVGQGEKQPEQPLKTDAQKLKESAVPLEDKDLAKIEAMKKQGIKEVKDEATKQ